MGAKPYPAYKDSGVEWIGEIPEHWEVKRLGRLGKERRDKNSALENENLLSLSFGTIKKKDIQSNDGLLPASFDAYTVVQPGDIVLRLTDLQNDKNSLRSALVRETGIITSAYVSFEPIDVLSMYLSWQLRCQDLYKVFYSLGGGLRQSATYQEVSLLLCFVPPLEEQMQIASFLDRETSKIDTLIDKQQQLINLLKEKRGSLISHTVTKGLNPNVPMKDSGVEWIGEIPEHWEVKRLKDVADVSYGVSQITEYVEQGIPILRATNVRSGKFTSVGLVFIRPSDVVPRMISLSDGDIIVVRSGATTGDSAIVTPELVGAIAGFDIVVRSKTIASKFCQYLFLSNYVRKFQWDSSSTRAAQPHLNSHELNGTILTSPPIEEQKQIASFLDRETSKIDTLIEKANQSIALLKERRSCLISAAVTGKIDVRGAV